MSNRAHLRNVHVGQCCWVVQLGHTARTVPVALVHIHVDCFAWLLRLEERLLCFTEPLLVLKKQRVLVVDIGELVRHVILGQMQRCLTLAALRASADRGVHKVVLLKHLRAANWPNFHDHLKRDCGVCSRLEVLLRHAKGVVPLSGLATMAAAA